MQRIFNLSGFRMFFLLVIVSAIPYGCDREVPVDPNFMILAGEPSDGSVIMQCRFAAADTLIDYDMPGKECQAYFEISEDSLFRKARKTSKAESNADNDYMIKEKVPGLKPATRYYYRAKAKLPSGEKFVSRTGTFETFPGKQQAGEISFVIATGFNYANYYGKDTTINRRYTDEPRKLGATGRDRELGFEAFDAVRKLGVDFFIANGDVVYYDKPSSDPAMWARTPEEMRAKWHRFFTMPRNREMCLELPVYFLKDDHDHRYNDCDTVYNDRDPSSQLGIEIFKEQVPITDPSDDDAKTYRTHRMVKDLQLWFVEGRDYRSPNRSKDTVGKTIWGKEQKEWLMRTLEESNATYKILISPTPMVGPDDAYKRDNHTNPGGFQTEQEEFFSFLAEEDLIGNGFYIICGDRHWQYHSIYPNGLEEFSCGAFIDQNSRAGRLPGDPNSTDPNAELTVPYVQTDDWGGGFLQVDLIEQGEQPVLFFRFRDIYGNIRYEVKREV
jgi:alkaline phosphatase D